METLQTMLILFLAIIAWKGEDKIKKIFNRNNPIN